MIDKVWVGIFPLSHFMPSRPHNHAFYLGITYASVGRNTWPLQERDHIPLSQSLWWEHTLYDFSLFQLIVACFVAQSIVYPLECSMRTLKKCSLWKLAEEKKFILTIEYPVKCALNQFMTPLRKWGFFLFSKGRFKKKIHIYDTYY